MSSAGSAADVVVIGGGIVGLATAYFLARRGVRVVLLEKGRFGWEQSSRNWGFIRQQGRDPAELPMAVLSNRIWSNLTQELGVDVEWCQGGNLAIAQNDDDLDRYAEGAAAAQGVGIDTQLLTAEAVRRLVPGVKGLIRGGLFTPSDGHAEPLKATLAFATAARAAGADLREYCAADEIYTTGSRVTGVRTAKDDIRAEVVICCAGRHSGFLARKLGVKLPQRSMRATVAATKPIPTLTKLGIWMGGLGIRQARDGSVILGRASARTAEHDITLESIQNLSLFWPIFRRNRDLFRLRVGMPLVRDVARHIPGTSASRAPFATFVDEEPAPSAATVHSSLQMFKDRFPQVPDVSIARRWAGVIDATPDLLPVIGEVKTVGGFILATGFSGHGFGLGPGAAHTVAQLVTEGHTEIDVRAMRFERFEEGQMSTARKVL